MVTHLQLPFMTTLFDHIGRSAEQASNEGQRSSEQYSLSYNASLLYVDILGLSALSECLARHATVSVDVLGNSMNIFFAKLIDQIAMHGGEIVKFAGNTLLAMWSTEKLATTAHCAAQCALTTQELLHDHPLVGNIHFSLRMAVGAGEITITQVDSLEAQRTILLIGSPLHQINDTIQQAAQGEVIVSSQVWTFIQKAATGQAKANGCVQLKSILSLARLPIMPRWNSSPELKNGYEGLGKSSMFKQSWS